MDDESSQRQIQQMVGFILNEAKDKAEEIDSKTLEEFNIERLKQAQQMKEKIRNVRRIWIQCMNTGHCNPNGPNSNCRSERN
jgi:vacuolar-type H+-ATPase subunit E/Vma4